MSFSMRLELLGRLRRHDVIVSVEINRAVALSVRGQEIHGNIDFVSGVLLLARVVERSASGRDIVPLARQTTFAETGLKQVGTGTIFLAGRILGGNGDELLKQGYHFLFVMVQPGENGL